MFHYQSPSAMPHTVKSSHRGEKLVDNANFLYRIVRTLEMKTYSVTTQTATTVMLVSGGYPESYEKGKEITGYDSIKDSIVYHAGTTSDQEGKVVTSGGRVMAITSFGNSIEEALDKSYRNIDKIAFDKMNFRSDIGFDLK